MPEQTMGLEEFKKITEFRDRSLAEGMFPFEVVRIVSETDSVIVLGANYCRGYCEARFEKTPDGKSVIMGSRFIPFV